MDRKSLKIGRRSVMLGGAATVAGLDALAGRGFVGRSFAQAPASFDTAVVGNTIKIGVTAGISGTVSFAGQQFSGFMQRSFEQVNAKGGVHGRKLQVIALDDGGKGNVALQNAQRLVQQEQVFAMTALGTATTAGIIEYLTAQNVPFLFPGAWNSELIKPVRANTFALYQPYDGQIAALAKWVFAKKGPGTAVIVRATVPALDPVAAVAASVTQASGGKVLATINTTYSQPEWASAVIQLKQHNPDYLFLLTTAPNSGRLWKELTQQKIFPRKASIGISPLADQSFLDASGPVPDDAIFAAVPGTVVTTAPAADSARALWPDQKIGIFGLEGATSAAVMVEAFRQIGPDLTRAKLVDLLANKFAPFHTPYSGTVAPAPDHLMLRSIGVSTIRNGGFVAASDELIQ